MDHPKELLVLTGGTGTVKLLKGLYKINPESLAILTNTGDDFTYYGLLVSPDTDAVIYALSEQLDETKMWGLKGDTFETQKILQKVDNADLPVANWFNLGDKDLGYCLYRTQNLRKGKTLTDVTKELTTSLGIKTLILPMSNEQVTTYFETMDGKEYHFAEFFIRLRSAEPIKEIKFVNADKVKATMEILNLIKEAKVILLGPSNPITSIGPILAIKEIREAIVESQAKKVVISPITGTQAYSGPAKIYMEAKGVEVSPIGIFDYYKDLADDYYFAETDKEIFGSKLLEKAKDNNKKIYFEDIFFPTTEKQLAFAKLLLNRYKL